MTHNLNSYKLGQLFGIEIDLTEPVGPYPDSKTSDLSIKANRLATLSFAMREAAVAAVLAGPSHTGFIVDE